MAPESPAPVRATGTVIPERSIYGTAARPGADASRVLALQGGAEFLCERCGERLALTLPMPVEVWARKVRGFELLHADCAPGGLAADPEMGPALIPTIDLPPGAPPEAD